MTEPIRAVKALCQATTHDPERIHGYQVDALLAHGSEHGVAILADGTLRPLTEGEATT